MVRYIGSIISGLLASLLIIWFASFLVREPADLSPKKPHIITMPRLLEETSYVLPIRHTQDTAWWDTESWIDYCCGCRLPGFPLREPAFTWSGPTANVSLPMHRPTAPERHRVTASSLFEGQWQSVILEARYPRQAEARGLEGEVLIEARLTPDGAVEAATIITPSAVGAFNRVATEVVLEARFDPPVRDGQQVRTMTRRFLIRFRLPAKA